MSCRPTILTTASVTQYFKESMYSWIRTTFTMGLRNREKNYQMFHTKMKIRLTKTYGTVDFFLDFEVDAIIVRPYNNQNKRLL